MFDRFSGPHRRAPHRDTIPLYLSIAAHLLVIGVISVSLVYVATELPEVPEILVFVAAAPPPPPPPPPPPTASRRAREVSKPVAARPRSAPVEPAKEILPEARDVDFEGEADLPGGVEGGVPGGIPGGIVGGLPPTEVVLPPPPPPPPPAPVNRGPVRVGGAITAPALISRVAPEYPNIAVNAKVKGVVVLEAIVGRDGRVEEVKVLRSIPLLDNAALAAVRQWRYSPLLLNGKPERFVLTVTVSFSLDS